MNARHPMGVLHSFFIKNGFNLTICNNLIRTNLKKNYFCSSNREIEIANFK